MNYAEKESKVGCLSKHEDIIKYILSLSVGTKISVRSVANELGVSDGTAYKSIKDCSSMGIVTTIPRIGTIRTQRIEKRTVKTLTFGEVINIIGGTLLGGKNGVYKCLNKFVIGAMTIDAIKKYISPQDLLIVGNREEVQKFGLSNECGVLITGGFGCSEVIKSLADQKCLPVISSSFDTFTVAKMISKAISENTIKKDIILTEDIMKSTFRFFYSSDNVKKFKLISSQANIDRFPVVNKDMKLVGMISSNDVRNCNDNDVIGKIMKKNIISVTPQTTVAYAVHVMVSEGIEFCPVIEDKKLIGIITKQTALRVLQKIVRQPQTDEIFEEKITKNFKTEKSSEREMSFSGKITPQMLSPVGTASWSTLNMLLTSMGMTAIKQNNIDVSLDSIMTCFNRPMQIDNKIHINTKIISIERSFCKVEVNMYDEKNELVGKSLMSAKILRK